MSEQHLDTPQIDAGSSMLVEKLARSVWGVPCYWIPASVLASTIAFQSRVCFRAGQA